ncbi:hypothetical protein DTL42_02305 [Bremerella cremea]|uniref:Leucine Rich repeats (2 copies) n=1 Tax=Bremerella cremea TaxID=1031537 RepID=A0A368KUF5_9BACT|nr:hypothetical protein [Bremerella cremea]RCS54009.1 hypothetical protein DTL42_02305 [Bremerella cremea]
MPPTAYRLCVIAFLLEGALANISYAQEGISPILQNALANAGALAVMEKDGTIDIKCYDQTEDDLKALLNVLPKALEKGEVSLALDGFDSELINELTRRIDLLRRLSHLDIGISSSITDTQVCQLAQFKNLRRLSLVPDQPIEVSDEALKCLSTNTALEILRLDYSRVTDEGLRHLQNLKKLHLLTLCSTRIEGDGFKHLRKLPIESLLVLDSEVSDTGLQEIGRLRRLRRLHLNGTPIQGDGLKYLGQSSPLQHLSLTATTVSDEALQHLIDIRSLKSLSVCDCPISDKAITHLSKMPQLQRLMISDTKITPEGIEELKKAIPNTTVE